MISLSKYLESAFNQVPIMDMYPIIEDARRSLGFSHPNNNVEVMQQATKITREFRKVQTTLKDSVLQAAEVGEPESLYSQLINHKADLEKYPNDEVSALYMCVRDTWLNGLIQMVATWISSGGDIESTMIGGTDA